ncbi:ABC transporter [Prosthecochloris sp. GSB1]|uniref:ABC transporter ATP-binding protein n=1 Tax=Prosthecochloris sp. GSB1 TaxID=281093 RepID=UPI000B8CFBA4|nr:ABC transporter ATP-binding protein [Prosthecochloris sp. GSB1]ASQ90391.1 ABC transporter [Prosthecochloris sp. GSB1]
MKDSQHALSFRDVVAGYRDRTVLDGVSFDVREGEFISLIGPNGCGKSTLLKTASALIRPFSGTVTIFGAEVSSLRPAARARLVGVVPQKVESPMAYTAGQIVMNGRTASSGLLGRLLDEDFMVIERSMIYTNVLHLKDRYFMELSGGEQQRVILAMVLAQEPRIIMLDESISHLDINHRYEVLRILRRINREKRMTVVLVSHDLSLSAEISDRMLLMNAGKIVSGGRPEEVLKPEVLDGVYDCELRVQHDPLTGAITVTGVLENGEGTDREARTVHVIAGGGTGIELYRRLSLQGFRLTTGVLNRMDSDAEAAEALGVEAALEKPFSAVGADSLRRALAMVAGADIVALSDVPFGPGNLVNLRLAEEALTAGKQVWMAEGIGKRDYTDGRQAAALAARLLENGAREWSSLHELVRELKA